MNHLTKVKMIQNLNEEELRRGVPINASWHMKVRCEINNLGSIMKVPTFTSEASLTK